MRPEPGLLIVADDVALDGAPVRQRQPDFARLGDEIADGEHDAGRLRMSTPLPVRSVPRMSAGEGVGGDDGADADDGPDRAAVRS